jgi:cytochrome c peroxidase
MRRLRLTSLLILVFTCSLSGSASAERPVVLGEADLTGGIPGSGPLTLAEIKEWLSKPENHEVLDVTLPLGLRTGQSQIKGLAENPLTVAKIELGRQLYFDTRLSADGTVSCGSCHHPQEGYSRHTATGVGIGGQKGGRNSPASYNRILSDKQFWDGRAGSLEEQAVGPIQNPIEMGNTHEDAVATLKGIPGYVAQFERVFPDSGVTIDNVGKAIAAFERVLVTGPSPFDYAESYQRFAAMDELDLEDLKVDAPDTYAEYERLKKAVQEEPMSESATRGWKLFFSKRVGCSNCHVGANLADEQYHNLGVGMAASEPDLGRYVVTKVEKDKGAFKTPTIRNVALTAPYMHDGSLATLEEVVEHYDKGGDKKRLAERQDDPIEADAAGKDRPRRVHACLHGKFSQSEYWSTA